MFLLLCRACWLVRLRCRLRRVVLGVEGVMVGIIMLVGLVLPLVRARQALLRMLLVGLGRKSFRPSWLGLGRVFGWWGLEPVFTGGIGGYGGTWM